MTCINERRIHNRFTSSDLSVVIQSLRGSAHFEPNGHLLSVDFNRYGMAVESPHCFNVGDVLLLDISDQNSNDIEVLALVCNRSKTEHGYRCGVFFQAEEGESHNTELEHSLLALEESLMLAAPSMA